MIKTYIVPDFRQSKFRFSNYRYYLSLSSSTDHEKLVSLLQSCKQVSQTAQIHCLILKTGVDSIQFPISKLLAQLSVQDTNYAASVFKHIHNPNVYMFNTMIRCYSISNVPNRGVSLFNLMRAQYFLPDQFSFISVLKCCSSLLAIQTGIGVHGVVLKSGFELILNIKNALLHFYSVCGRIQDAHKVFDEIGEQKDSVSWSTLMGGYLGVSRHDIVVNLFREMYMNGFSTSVTSILSVLLGVGEVKVVPLGKCLHALCIKIGFLSNLKVITALMSMYAKNDSIYSSRQIFDEIHVQKDVVLWNCMIEGYAKSGQLDMAMELLRSMKLNNMQPNSSTLAGLLSAFSDAKGAISVGQHIQDYVDKHKLELDVILATSLVDMYAKSGLLTKAIDVFDRMKCKDVKSWTAMISGYGAHGDADCAIKLFQRMEDEGFVPNEVTFLALLNSCSHGGLVKEGMDCFRKMVEVYRLTPKIEHYGCVIDLLGRAGLLEEAYGLISGLPVERDATAWRALLGACRVYGDVDLAKRVKWELEQIDAEHPADLLALNATYAIAGMIPIYRGTLVKEVDCEQPGKKEAGCSTIVY